MSTPLSIKIVQYFWGEHNHSYPTIRTINEAYCRRHGYGYVAKTFMPREDRAWRWSKIPAMREELHECDFLLYLDADAFFYSHELMIEEELIPLLKDKQIMMSADCAGEGARFQSNKPNTGVILVRNSEKSAKILRVWDESSERPGMEDFRFNSSQEQAACYQTIWQEYSDDLMLLKDYYRMNGAKGIFIRHLMKMEDKDRLGLLQTFLVQRKGTIPFLEDVGISQISEGTCSSNSDAAPTSSEFVDMLSDLCSEDNPPAAVRWVQDSTQKLRPATFSPRSVSCRRSTVRRSVSSLMKKLSTGWLSSFVRPPDICIVGYGVVGRHLAEELNGLNFAIKDKYQPQYAHTSGTYKLAFICVPTEALPDGFCDLTAVEDAVANIDAEIIVMKSAVPVGTAEMLMEKYGKNIVISPEYYGATLHSPKTPSWVVLGGQRGHCAKVAQLYYRIKDGSFRVIFTDWRTAELAKYGENAFLALKVTFCNEMARIAALYGINYEELRECLVADKRFGDSHTFVHKDSPFYDSHCFNKDVPCLVKQGQGEAKLIQAMHEINRERKSR